MKHNLILALALLVSALPGLLLFNGCSAPNPKVEAKAAIVDQLSDLQPNEAFTVQITQYLEDYGFKVDLYQGDDVTVDLYRKLPTLGYRLIIFRAHSGLLGSGDKTVQKTCLFTDEPYSETAHIAEQLSDQLAKARIDGNHPWVFGIGADFVNRSMQGKFDHTVIIMMGCSTLYIDDLAQSFIEKGTSSFIGWDATVGLTYTDGVTPTLLEKLLVNRVSLQTAVAETINERGPDPDYGASLKYYPQESSKKTLNELMR